MNSDVDSSQSQAVRDEIADLERRLEDAKGRLNGKPGHQNVPSSVPKIFRSDGIHCALHLAEDLI
jgi:hypothetical protein